MSEKRRWVDEALDWAGDHLDKPALRRTMKGATYFAFFVLLFVGFIKSATSILKLVAFIFAMILGVKLPDWRREGITDRRERKAEEKGHYKDGDKPGAADMLRRMGLKKD